jgi:hypothetical protein
MYRNAIKNTWTVEEVDFSMDTSDLRTKMSAADRHLIQRLVAFFATGDTIVSNNLVLNLYQHINAPEARMYLSRQLYEEALHVQFYLTLLDTYIPDPTSATPRSRRSRTFPRSAARRVLLQVDRFGPDLQRLETREHRRAVSAQPDLLRRLHRRPVLLRRLRLRLLPALARPAARPGLGHQLGVPRREPDAHGLRLRRGAHRARQEPELFDDKMRRRSRRCWKKPSPAKPSSPKTCSPAAWSACR